MAYIGWSYSSHLWSRELGPRSHPPTQQPTAFRRVYVGHRHTVSSVGHRLGQNELPGLLFTTRILLVIKKYLGEALPPPCASLRAFISSKLIIMFICNKLRACEIHRWVDSRSVPTRDTRAYSGVFFRIKYPDIICVRRSWSLLYFFETIYCCMYECVCRAYLPFVILRLFVIRHLSRMSFIQCSPNGHNTVSYTHLTLPTICSV